jgi:hypothetical protein
MEIKTIDVNAKEWFDKVNGNSYFSAIVTLNYGMPDAESFKLPFQYGYGEQYIWEAREELVRRGYLPENDSEGYKKSLWSMCQIKGIILRYSKQTGCKKRDL